jgi:hypothetical protein
VEVDSSVIPAEAGIQPIFETNRQTTWMPVVTGMTNFYFV